GKSAVSAGVPVFRNPAFISSSVPQVRGAASSWMGAIIFVVVGIRVLLIQQRLVNVQNRPEFEANHDVLTGLWNRTPWFDCLDREWGGKGRTGHSIGWIMTNLNPFKASTIPTVTRWAIRYWRRLHAEL